MSSGSSRTADPLTALSQHWAHRPDCPGDRWTYPPCAGTKATQSSAPVQGMGPHSTWGASLCQKRWESHPRIQLKHPRAQTPCDRAAIVPAVPVTWASGSGLQAAEAPLVLPMTPPLTREDSWGSEQLPRDVTATRSPPQLPKRDSLTSKEHQTLNPTASAEPVCPGPCDSSLFVPASLQCLLSPSKASWFRQ